MLEIGQIFNKNGKEYCFLDTIQLEGQEYLCFSIEENKKLDYMFYTVKSFDEVNGYNLEPIKDENLHMKLFEIEIERAKANI